MKKNSFRWHWEDAFNFKTVKNLVEYEPHSSLLCDFICLESEGKGSVHKLNRLPLFNSWENIQMGVYCYVSSHRMSSQENNVKVLQTSQMVPKLII